MKKSFAIILITFLLIQIVIAQTNITGSSINNSISGFKEKTDSIAEKEILINENLAIFVRVLSGIQGPVTISYAIMIALIWIMMLIFLRNIMIFTLSLQMHRYHRNTTTFIFPHRVQIANNVEKQSSHK